MGKHAVDTHLKTGCLLQRSRRTGFRYIGTFFFFFFFGGSEKNYNNRGETAKTLVRRKRFYAYIGEEPGVTIINFARVRGTYIKRY